jgi:transcriptional regulator of acetoin/glycerol metabolism
MLSLSSTALSEALHASDVFASAWENLFDAARRNGKTSAPTQELPLWSGLRLQTQAWLAGSSAQAFKAVTPNTAAKPLHPAPPSSAPKGLKDAQTEMILEAVNQARGNVAEAARTLGISRATVYRKLSVPKA